MNCLGKDKKESGKIEVITIKEIKKMNREKEDIMRRCSSLFARGLIIFCLFFMAQLFFQQVVFADAKNPSYQSITYGDTTQKVTLPDEYKKAAHVIVSRQQQIVKSPGEKQNDFTLQWGETKVTKPTKVYLDLYDVKDKNQETLIDTLIVKVMPAADVITKNSKVSYKDKNMVVSMKKKYYITSSDPKIVKNPGEKEANFALEWEEVEVTKNTPVTLSFYLPADEDNIEDKDPEDTLTFMVVPSKSSLSVKYSGKAIRGGETSDRFIITGGSGKYTIITDQPNVIDDQPEVKTDYFTLKTKPVTSQQTVNVHVSDEDKKTYDLSVTVTSSTDPGYDTKRFMFRMGAITFNPYRITNSAAETASSPDFVIDKDGTDTRLFFEFLFRNRNAWKEDEKEKSPKFSFLLPQDYEFSLGFAASGSGGDPSVAVTSGSGDFFGEVSIGWNLPLFPPDSEKGKVRHRFNLEAIYGFATEKNFMRIHSYLGPGITSTWGIKQDWMSNKVRQLELLIGAYAVNLDRPTIINYSANPSTDGKLHMASDDGVRPAFERHWLTLFRSDINFPIQDNAYFSIAGRFFTRLFNQDKDFRYGHTWSIKTSVTAQIDKVVNSVLGAFK